MEVGGKQIPISYTEIAGDSEGTVSDYKNIKFLFIVFSYDDEESVGNIKNYIDFKGLVEQSN